MTIQLRAGNLAGTQATGANADGLMFTVNNCLNLSDVRLPSSVSVAHGVGYVAAKSNALSADAALCHFSYTSINGF